MAISVATKCYQILDLGVEGKIFHDQLYKFVENVVDYDTNWKLVAANIHHVFISYIVGLLNKPPAEAQESIKRSKGIAILHVEFHLLQLREYDVFTKLCMDNALLLYLKIRSQLQVKFLVEYSLKQAGIDFVVIREVVSTLKTKA